MVIDFADLQKLVGEIGARFDHRNVNEVPPFDQENTTAELLARFFYVEANRALAGREGGAGPRLEGRGLGERGVARGLPRGVDSRAASARLGRARRGVHRRPTGAAITAASQRAQPREPERGGRTSRGSRATNGASAMSSIENRPTRKPPGRPLERQPALAASRRPPSRGPRRAQGQPSACEAIADRSRARECAAPAHAAGLRASGWRRLAESSRGRSALCLDRALAQKFVPRRRRRCSSAPRGNRGEREAPHGTEKELSRRSLLSRAGIAIGGALTLGALQACSRRTSRNPPPQQAAEPLVSDFPYEKHPSADFQLDVAAVKQRAYADLLPGRLLPRSVQRAPRRPAAGRLAVHRAAARVRQVRRRRVDGYGSICGAALELGARHEHGASRTPPTERSS